MGCDKAIVHNEESGEVITKSFMFTSKVLSQQRTAEVSFRRGIILMFLPGAIIMLITVAVIITVVVIRVNIYGEFTVCCGAVVIA